MKGKKEFQTDEALLVREDDLRFLDDFLQGNFDAVVYTLYCIDDSHLYPGTLDEVLAYENPAYKQIVHIKIRASLQGRADSKDVKMLEAVDEEEPEEDILNQLEADLLAILERGDHNTAIEAVKRLFNLALVKVRAEEWKKRQELIVANKDRMDKLLEEMNIISDPSDRELVLDFGQPGPVLRQSTTKFTLYYQDTQWGGHVERELISRLRELRPWYWWLFKIQGFVVWLFISLLGFTFLLIRSVIPKLKGTYTPSSTGTTLEWYDVMTIIIFSLIASIGVTSLLDRLKNYFFPKVFFALGKQHSEFLRRQRILQFIFGAVLLSLVLEVIGGFFSDLILY